MFPYLIIAFVLSMDIDTFFTKIFRLVLQRQDSQVYNRAAFLDYPRTR